MIGRVIGLSLAATVAVLTGCASVPEAPPAMDQAAKSFTAPKDKAGVYVYRNELMGTAVKLDVYLDGKHLGETASKTYFYTEVEPGIRTVMGKGENESAVRFHALAGKLYYIWQEIATK